MISPRWAMPLVYVASVALIGAAAVAPLNYGCATPPGIRDVPQLSSTCPRACPAGEAVEGAACCYDVDGYGWDACAWNACGVDDACRRQYTTWTLDHPERAPCGSSGPVGGRMLPTPCRHPDGRILIPVQER